jgi:hypothetical protein
LSKITQRMAELSAPIDQQIMMCDDREETLMLACAMLQKVKVILESNIGVEGRRTIIGEAND